ncbi:MAG TPA: hypothetical protein VN730_01605 [Steroidobacteraceae bacterium]|nr:hypothetical protein [Steroidobacteraceae bacterium]
MSTNWVSEVGDLLQRYSGAQQNTAASNSTAAPDSATAHQRAQEDFQKVAQSAPPSAMSGALAAAFRSPNTPEFPQLIAHLFGESNGEQRAGILQRLLEAAGPAASSGGLLGGLSSIFSRGAAAVTPQQAQQISPQSVQELAKQAATRDPSIVERASEFYAQHPRIVQVLGAAVLAEAMRHMARHH